MIDISWNVSTLEDEGTVWPWNLGICLLIDAIMSCLRGLKSSAIPLQSPEISHILLMLWIITYLFISLLKLSATQKLLNVYQHHCHSLESWNFIIIISSPSLPRHAFRIIFHPYSNPLWLRTLNCKSLQPVETCHLHWRAENMRGFSDWSCSYRGSVSWNITFNTFISNVIKYQ
jgi:hypothetical protein